MYTFVDCNEICRNLFDIGKKEMKLYHLLITRSYRVDELQKEFGNERSTIQRCLARLVRCGMVKRQRHIIRQGGGHYYTYQGLPPKELISWMQECVNHWYTDMLTSIENLKNF